MQSTQLRNLNDGNAGLQKSTYLYARDGNSVVDSNNVELMAMDVNQFYKDDPPLSENALMIIVISVCCFIAIVIILIIIGYCYTKRPSASEIFGSSAYEIHSPNSLPLTSVPESTGETSMQVPI